MIVWRPLAEHERRLAKLNQWPVVAVLFSLLMTVIGAGLMSILIGRRLRTMTQSIEAFAAGDRTAQVHVKNSIDEFDDLARAINTALLRIRSDMGAMMRINGSISHQLIKPVREAKIVVRDQVARLMSVADHLDTRGGDVRNAAQTLEQTEVQLGHLVGMGEAIQDLLSAGRHSRQRVSDTVDLWETCQSIAQQRSPLARQRGIRIEIAGEPVEVQSSQVAVEQMLSNLLSNAIIYGPPASLILVTVFENEVAASISVQDEGEGPPAVVIEDVFHSAYFVERTYSARDGVGGHGLGLLTVRELANNCGIQLSQQRLNPRGWKATLSWSKAQTGGVSESRRPWGLLWRRVQSRMQNWIGRFRL